MPAADSPPAPVVSVILATYHWTSVLRHAIRSVLWQTFSDFELLVIGDGCTDDTAEVVAGFADPRIHWDNLPANSGNQAAPNNRGLATARGEYVAYLHQDDLWLPGHLSALVKALEAGGDVAHTLTLDVGPPPDRIRRVVGLPNSGRFGPDKVEVFTPAVMHRTEVARRFGGWGNWQSLSEPTYVNFLSRIIGPYRALVTVPELTVVKFHSGMRRNSYREQRSDEQAEYFERITSEPDFAYREILRAMDDAARKRYLRGPFAWSPDAPPGSYIERLRRVRGLAPLDVPIDEPARSTTSGPGAPAWLRLMQRVRNGLPPKMRKPLGHFLGRTGRFLVGP